MGISKSVVHDNPDSLFSAVFSPDGTKIVTGLFEIRITDWNDKTF